MYLLNSFHLRMTQILNYSSNLTYLVIYINPPKNSLQFISLVSYKENVEGEDISLPVSLKSKLLQYLGYNCIFQATLLTQDVIAAFPQALKRPSRVLRAGTCLLFLSCFLYGAGRFLAFSNLYFLCFVSILFPILCTSLIYSFYLSFYLSIHQLTYLLYLFPSDVYEVTKEMTSLIIGRWTTSDYSQEGSGK